MIIHHHLDDATLLAYASGTLDEALSVAAASHAAMCDECLSKIRTAEAIGGSVLEEIDETPMDAGALDALLERLDGPLPDNVIATGRSLPSHAIKSDLPLPLARHMDWPLDEVPWRKVAPGISVCDLPVSDQANGQLKLLKIAAGKALPEHGHGGTELTLILKGAYSDEFGRFAAGDAADHDVDAEHKPIVEPGEDCICVIATEAPTKFKGLVSRILQPIVGI